MNESGIIFWSAIGVISFFFILKGGAGKLRTIISSGMAIVESRSGVCLMEGEVGWTGWKEGAVVKKGKDPGLFGRVLYVRKR